MTKTTFSRGLAVSAVSALALSGIAFMPSAQAAEGDAVVLLSQWDGTASLRIDGEDFPYQSIELVAEQLDPLAAVFFQYNTDPQAADDDEDWTTILGSADIRGRFLSTVWDANAGALIGSSVALRAMASTVDGPTYSTRRNVMLADQDSDVDSVAVTADSSQTALGYFAQPYADSGQTGSLLAVAGTTSATGGDVELSWWRSSDGTYQGTTDAAVRKSDLKFFDGSLNDIEGGEYDAAFDIGAFDLENEDAIAVRAERGSDAFVTGELYAQQIGGLAVVADGSVATSTSYDATLVVRDDSVGQAVAGAEVRRSTDGSLVGYTDGEGEVTVTQPTESIRSYYVNTTDVDGFEEGVDFVAEVTAPAYTPVASDVVPVLADGEVFDDDEYAAGDIALQVVDQEGTPVGAGEVVSYVLQASGTVEPPELAPAVTDADGRVVVPFDPAGADGEYVLTYASPVILEDTPRSASFVAGDATLALTPAKGTAASGAQVAYAGSLTVEGEPVSGRTIDLAYTRGTELVPGTGADAGILTGGKRSLTGLATTASDGTFAVTVDDVAEAGNPTETVGTLVATAKAAQETASGTAAFGSGKGTARLQLGGSSKGAAPDRLQVTGPTSVAGESFRLFRKVGSGRWKLVRSARLNRTGDAALTVKDTNRKATTSYYVQLLTSARVTGSKSNVRKLP